MEEDGDLGADLVQVARAALSVANLEMTPLLRKLARRYRATHPEVARELVSMLRSAPMRSVGTAEGGLIKPVDSESRLPLVRVEDPVVLEVAPILQTEIRSSLDDLVSEHLHPERLLEADLVPTRTALFVGPPGVGKTLAARWLAHELNRPLLILDLASVMSSLLGRTGENVRRVLEYAKQTQCVLLLDELDAVAKRRDDATEIGELKRLVTVLLQEIDAWPDGSLLLAATNHASLLDPAVWRRFEIVVNFPLPEDEALAAAIREYLDDESIPENAIRPVAAAYRGYSYSDIRREVMRARRTAAIHGLPVLEALYSGVKDHFRKLAPTERVQLAMNLMADAGLSQRKTHEITGVSRDTLRKYGADNLSTDEGVNCA